MIIFCRKNDRLYSRVTIQTIIFRPFKVVLNVKCFRKKCLESFLSCQEISPWVRRRLNNYRKHIHIWKTFDQYEINFLKYFSKISNFFHIELKTKAWPNFLNYIFLKKVELKLFHLKRKINLKFKEFEKNIFVNGTKYKKGKID